MRGKSGFALPGVRRAAVALVAAVAAFGWLGNEAVADFTDGAIAAKRISMEAGIRIWRKAAWQDDDFLSEMQLGDTYGNENGDNKFYDPVEAYVWYYLASHSAGIGAHIDDRSARRIVSNNVHRALWHQNKLMVLLSADDRQEARNRIVYILACRGADGFVQLGQIHATGMSNGGGSDFGSDSAETYGALTDMAHSYNSFRDRSQREFNYGREAQARQMMGIASNSVIVPNDGEALVYFHIADNMGHPLAKEYLRGLDRGVRRNSPLGNRIADEAARKAGYWSAPFEFYPPGTNASGVPYSDECYSTIDKQRALVLAATQMPPKAAEHAVVFLGFPATALGVQKFQSFLVDTATGRLTAAESVRAVQMAAIKGDAASQNALGVMYAHGIGVLRNYVRAEYWFKKAADQRYGAALYHLGVLYKAGPEGIHQDLSKANDYFTASAMAGFRPTMNQLADLLNAAASGPPRPGQH
ncbi:MAG TPA: tetratricopeptide repeat protein [Rhizomicrobium sp.]|nr:tetratricopeptide repeat protein [Rhizomicrobium sp.]